MTRQDLIRAFPIKRISPDDGMAVTRDVWETAHNYHRQRQQLYDSFSHGAGIVTGLAVEARDEPDSSVCIRPGIAVDSKGQVIVLPDEIKRYNFEEADGLLYLLLSYAETQPEHDAGRDEEGDPKYIYAKYSIGMSDQAADASSVELARIRRHGANAAIVNAQNPDHPGPNEIDLRFRRVIEASPQEVATVAVCHLGEGTAERHGRGVNYLARAVQHFSSYRAWVDLNVALAPGLEYYTLVYLVGQGTFDLTPEEMRILYDYVVGGGTLLIESCRRESDDRDPPADAVFDSLLNTLGFKLTDLTPPHPLLLKPFLFAAPPLGFETLETPGVRAGDGVIFSTCDYGCLWQGKRRQITASREDIRAALEWGTNVVTYALDRRRRAK